MEQIGNFKDQNGMKNSLETKMELTLYFKDQYEVLT